MLNIDGKKLLISTCLNWVDYSAEQKLLKVEFRNGGIYEYHGVPAWKIEGLLTAKSPGNYFMVNIAHQYPREGSVAPTIKTPSFITVTRAEVENQYHGFTAEQLEVEAVRLREEIRQNVIVVEQAFNAARHMVSKNNENVS